MRQILLLIILINLISEANAQGSTLNVNINQNIADRLLATDGKLTIGGYGEVHYNQPFGAETRNTGVLDVHRMVLLFGYNFNKRTQFVTELEFEHVSEVYVEQAL
jgi:hypothetical protein